MLEYFLITVIVAAGLAGLLTYLWATSKDERAIAAKSETARVAASKLPAVQRTPEPGRNGSSTRVPPPLSLKVPNATHVPLRMVTFLRLYGLAYAPLRDFCFIQGPLTKEQLHPLVATSMLQMHCDGDVIGPDAMEFLFHGRELQCTEMLSFVLLDGLTQPESRIVAFVDKMRFPVRSQVIPT